MRKTLAALFIAALACGLSLAAEKKKEEAKPPEPASNFRQEAWKKIPEADMKALEALSSEYKDFLRGARHELQAVAAAERMLKKEGFRPLESYERLRAGDRFYAVNRGRALIAGVAGKKSLSAGAVLSASHIDAPRIELKANALYESDGFAMFQTIYHGGIKNYQWANVPLALVGRVSKKDGTSADIAIGLEGEPWLVIPDMAPHEDKDYRERTQRQVLKGEELDPVVGSRPGAEASVEKAVAEILEKQYGIGREDFVSAQLALVPALPVGDVGLDRSMIGGYGQDDLLCSFVSLRALLDAKNPERTAIVYLAANEETGSQNVMGAGSTFLADTVLDMLEKELGRAATLREHRRAMAEIHAVSADVTTGVHPTFSTQEKSNAARLGGGVVLKRYGMGEDPVSEVLAKVRNLLDQNGIPWQTHTYKVDGGGGGTLGGFLSDDGMDVVDIGVPILAMHAPWSVASKADLWWLFKFYGAFYGMK